jgi:hypothetical protein
MEVKIIKECGYEEAVLGFSLSYNSNLERVEQILPRYAFGIPGENKFLESIYIWIDVNAPRFWWSESDTYRLSSKNSESTMHTLGKRLLNQKDFEYPIQVSYLSWLNDIFQLYKEKKISIDQVKNELPEGFLQRRIWCMNYKCLQNIYNQRHNHRLPQWHYFCDTILSQIQHPEFIVNQNGGK